MAITANQLSSLSSTLLPPTITEPIFKKASETSAVMQLARKVPLAVNATTAIPITMDIPVADWVVEGGTKPTGNAGYGVKLMTGKKVALLMPVSQELAMTNPAGLYSLLQSDLPTAISRAFDYAAIHGLSLRTGGAGPFTESLDKTPNAQVIGSTSAVNGGVYVDLVKGVQQVVNAGNGAYEFSGFAADPRLKPELMLSVDTIGRPLMVDNPYSSANDSGNSLNSNIIGYPAAYNAGVSGRYYRAGNAVQIITMTATGGTFTLQIAGQQTAAQAFNVATATLQTAVQALNFPGAATTTVTGTAGTTYTITLGGPGAVAQINGKLLTGGTATVADSPQIDSGLRAIGGDWSQCAWGQGMDISIKISTEASYTDGVTVHSAFQENLVLLLVEAYFGFVVGDLSAFVAYTHAAGS